MLSITLLCVGKLKERFWEAACQEYAKRLGAFYRLNIAELPEQRLPDNPSAAQIEAALAAEGKRLLAKIPPGAVVIALCIEGQAMSSEAFAETLQKLTAVTSHIALVIGGSYGLSPEVKAAARLRLSLSPMTFPHHLARVMVLEQLYRAAQIAAGGKYHK